MGSEETSVAKLGGSIRACRLLIGLLWIAAAAQVARYYPRLPEVVASHFDAAGRPNDWAPKVALLAIYLAVLVLMTVIFAVVPGHILKVPDSMINLPNKAYWLAPERRAVTEGKLALFMAECGVATIALLVCVFQMVFTANLSRAPSLPKGIVVLLVAFLAYMTVWTVRLFLAFKVRSGEASRRTR
ncbi:MAG: DUF1648 domain-containing protein [Deltaproteobacteria bacterium]|nr:DUF1648 domain-containing protein [Deltaproteobacteria bacterium]